jgi:hypothetical protein
MLTRMPSFFLCCRHPGCPADQLRSAGLEPRLAPVPGPGRCARLRPAPGRHHAARVSQLPHRAVGVGWAPGRTVGRGSSGCCTLVARAGVTGMRGMAAASRCRQLPAAVGRSCWTSLTCICPALLRHLPCLLRLPAAGTLRRGATCWRGCAAPPTCTPVSAGAAAAAAAAAAASAAK